ncbi:hypothetical protein BN159_2523 [Streptomyces davaonensis JCM 4913]|uniref:HEAT repeat domain-containing protein n=1 Tax=Streptomyces davaonensis (strain DSM 101723 / JCM 4913 / KCC S-0913 / 768) TaxID=1214101 RepID=K4R1A1_STRDJ|nr:hypothetical protein BN159_2523 [Streptomyces davaonensis JCM 4913]
MWSAWRFWSLPRRRVADLDRPRSRTPAMSVPPGIVPSADESRGFGMSAGALVIALVRLGDPAAVPTLVDLLARDGEAGGIGRSVLQALGAFGATAASALAAIRPLIRSSDGHVRTAAVAALWDIGGDSEEVLPLLYELLAESAWPTASGAADVLGRIGPPAAPHCPASGNCSATTTSGCASIAPPRSGTSAARPKRTPCSTCCSPRGSRTRLGAEHREGRATSAGGTGVACPALLRSGP